MNIVVVTSEYSQSGGGLAYSCLLFTEMLKNFGHSVSVITPILSEYITGGYNPSLGYELALEERLKLDACSYTNTNLFISFGSGFNGYYGALLAHKCNSRFWVMFRGSDANLCKWNQEQKSYNSFAVERAEKIVCLSQEIADNLSTMNEPHYKLVVIPNPVEMKNKVSCSFKEAKLVIGTGATNLNEKKGISRLIKMISAYKNKYPQEEIQLELVGNVDCDYLAQYKQIAQEYNVSKNILFYGQVDRMKFREIQSKWNLYVQASICEGMGNSVTDAMAMGKPVMISNTGYVAECAMSLFPEIVFKSFIPEEMAVELYNLLHFTDVENMYSKFYSSFFDNVKPEIIENTWKNLLSYRKPICSVSHPIHGILSVSLHDVSGTKHDNITTPTSVFSKFVNDIHERGYKLCSMSEYLSRSNSEKANLIVCTFDDGYQGLLSNALPIMQEYGFTATVFVCTDYIGECNSWNYKDKTMRKHLNMSELLSLQSNGWEIGSHGVTHESLLKLNDDEVIEQLAGSKRLLEEKFGPIKTYAYPYGDYSEFIEKQVKKYYDSAFLLTQGGVFLAVDSHRIRRYYISEIYEIIKQK